MKMGFIEIEEPNLATAQAGVQRLEFSHKGGTLFGIGFAQQLLALFPTETCCTQEDPQGVAANPFALFLLNPAP